MGVKRADKRRMVELRMEIEVEESFKRKLVRSRAKWAGHVERMGDNIGRHEMPRKWREKGGEEECYNNNNGNSYK